MPRPSRRRAPGSPPTISTCCDGGQSSAGALSSPATNSAAPSRSSSSATRSGSIASISIRRCIGRILRVNGQPATIIGVMPERMRFPDNAGSELWLPFIPTDAQLARDRRLLGAFGRLAAGVGADSGGARNRSHRAADQGGASRSDQGPGRREARDIDRAISRRRRAADADHGDGRGDLRAADRLRQRRQPAAVAIDVPGARSRGPLCARRHAAGASCGSC